MNEEALAVISEILDYAVSKGDMELVVLCNNITRRGQALKILKDE